MIAAFACFVVVAQQASGPYWTWPTPEILAAANREPNLATKLDMALLGVYRTKIEGRIEDRAIALSIAGSAYSKLGDQRRGLVCYESALALGPSADRAAQLQNNLAIVFSESGRFAEAERYARLVIQYWLNQRQDASQQTRLARSYNQLGNALQHQARNADALAAFEQSLVYRYLADTPERQAGTMANIGSVLIALDRGEEARTYLHSALAVQMREKLALNQADTLTVLARLERNSPEIAVVLLKQAVSLIQAERKMNESAPADLQTSFAAANSDAYRGLADVLLKLGRIGEASRVLDLLKQREAGDYFRGAVGNETALEESAEEHALWETWKRLPEESGALFYEYDKLRAMDRSALTAEQRERLADLKVQLAEASRIAREIYSKLEAQVGQREKGPSIGENSDAMQRIVGDLATRTNTPTAALRVFAFDGYVVTVLSVVDGTLIYRTPYPVTEWNSLVGRLGLALRNRFLDPRPLGNGVYKLLFARVERELSRRGVRQLLISLDGPLRYVPIGALWDGKSYLAKRYQISYHAPYTPIARAASSVWRVAGFAAPTSRQFGDLPGAKDEVESIVQDTTGGSGLFPGRRFIGPSFTPDAFLQTLDARTERVIHLATHFVLTGELENSFLVAGNDQEISLAQLTSGAGSRALFQDVDLLYLSACDTAEVTPDGKLKGDGREVDSFAMFALDRSAATVVASLWNLNDGSGGRVARAFYRLRKQNPDLPLGAIVQRAQVEVMGATGVEPVQARSDTTSRIPDAVAGCPPYVPDPSKPLAHPYYWAPIVVYGSVL